MSDILIEKFVLIEKDGSLAIVLSEKECKGFDFGNCSLHLSDEGLEFEPEMYSSKNYLTVRLDDEQDSDLINQFNELTVAQVKESDEFGDIYKIEIL